MSRASISTCVQYTPAPVLDGAGELAEEVGARQDGLVAGRLAGGQARGEATDLGVPGHVVEEHDALAPGGALNAGGRQAGPVQRGDPAVVGPAGHHVAQVDDEAAGHHGHGRPPVGPHDLQAAGGLVEAQDRERAVVGVGAGAELARQRAVVEVGVVDGPHGAGVVREERLEVVGRQPQSHGHDRQQPARQVCHGAEVGLPGGAQARRVLGPAGLGQDRLGARRDHAGQVQRPHVEGLLEVRRRGVAQGAGQGLALDGGVAVGVVLRRGRAAALGGQRQVEELPRCTPDRPDGRLGHAVAHDDEEADVPAGLVHGTADGRERLAAGGRGRDVDDWDGRVRVIPGGGPGCRSLLRRGRKASRIGPPAPALGCRW